MRPSGNRRSSSVRLLLFLVVASAFPMNADAAPVAGVLSSPFLVAYADPGSGALIYQMLVAMVIGTGFYFRRIRTWISTTFSRGKKKAEE